MLYFIHTIIISSHFKFLRLRLGKSKTVTTSKKDSVHCEMLEQPYHVIFNVGANYGTLLPSLDVVAVFEKVSELL